VTEKDPKQLYILDAEHRLYKWMLTYHENQRALRINITTVKTKYNINIFISF